MNANRIPEQTDSSPTGAVATQVSNEVVETELPPFPTTAAAGASHLRQDNPRAWHHFVRSATGLLAAGYLVVVTILCFGADLWSPYNPLTNDLAHGLEGPSGKHWLGTDQLGRDVVSRLLYGGRPVLVGVLEATAICVVLGVALGVLSGYRSGVTDTVVSRATDIWMSLPGIVILLLVLTVFGASQTLAMVTLGFLFAPQLLRVARGATIVTRQELYVTAARAFGLTSWQIMLRHILPRIMGPVIVSASLLMAQFVLVQSGLAFLGLTVRPPAPSWGGMVTDASQVLQQQQWLIIPSGVAIVITVVAFVLLGEAIRDAGQDARSATHRKLHHDRRAEQTLMPDDTSTGADESESPDALLRVRDLRVALPLGQGWTVVVDNVSFDLRPGETLGLVGESGCGKSVTALALLNLIPGGGKVTGGTIDLGGTQLVGLSERKYRRIRGTRVAYISQEPMSSLDPSFTIGSQLREAIAQHQNLDAAECRKRSVELLTMVGLPDPEQVGQRYPHQVSGGMAQRVVIARALAGDPEVLIADEPTTALDSTVQQEILKLLLSIQAKNGMSIMLVTHDLGVVAQTCNRAVVMYAGQVVEQASVVNLFTSPKHPYTAALLAADPHRAKRGARIQTIPGTVPDPLHWPPGCRFSARCRLSEPGCDAGPIALHDIGAGRGARCIHVDALDVIANHGEPVEEMR